jgi:hypothetical protein
LAKRCSDPGCTTIGNPSTTFCRFLDSRAHLSNGERSSNCFPSEQEREPPSNSRANKIIVWEDSMTLDRQTPGLGPIERARARGPRGAKRRRWRCVPIPEKASSVRGASSAEWRISGSVSLKSSGTPHQGCQGANSERESCGNEGHLPPPRGNGENVVTESPNPELADRRRVDEPSGLVQLQPLGDCVDQE